MRIRRSLVGLFIFLAGNALAQNLVPNPSFELYKKNPCLGKFRTVGEPLSDYIDDWYMPTPGTTDLYDSDSIVRGTDCEIYSYYQKAHTGYYLIGIFTCFYVAPDYYDPDYREYLQVKLTKPLTPGQVYQASMFASLASYSGHRTNNLGLLISLNPITKTLAPTPPLCPPILQTPQVVDTAVLADTNWHQIKGHFVADKPYQYLTVGNFFDDKHTIIQPTGKNSYLGPGAYYYVDDVAVEEVPNTPLVTLPNLGADTTLCQGQAITLHLPNKPQTTYRWQDGSTASSRIITQSGTYYVTATTGVYSVTDTLHLTVLPPIKLPQDTTLCQSEVLTLAPSYPTKNFVWNTGSTDSTLSVSQSGQYWVKVVNNQCNVADTINVQLVDCPSNVPNVFTPNGDTKNEAFVIDNVELRPWRLQIYNRWGSRVFESEPYRNQWRGEGLPEGVYYYDLYCASLRRRLKGWVQILR